MDVNLLRALLWVERERLRSGKRALRIVLALALLPTTVLSAHLGWSFALALPHLNPAKAGSGLAVGLFALALLAAIWDGTPALDPRPLHPFQVRSGALFGAELLLSLLTPFKLAQATLLIVFALGAGAARPLLLPLLLCGALCLLVSLVCLERLLGRLTRLAAQHLRLALVFALLVPPMRLMVNAMSREILGKPLMNGTLDLERVSQWLPADTQVASWGLWGILAIALGMAALLGLTFLALRRELNGEGATSQAQAGRLWRFRRPWVGVARHRWESLWASKQGRFFLFVPLLVPLCQVDAMLFRQRPAPAFLIGCVGWVMLPLGALTCTLFGLDRKAARVFWTWPLEDGELLLGKLVGTAAYQAVIILLSLAVLPLTTPMPLRLLPAVFLFCAALACFQLRVGLRHSLEFPRPLDPKGLNPGEFDDDHLAKLGRLLLPWLLLVLTWLTGSFLGERALLGLMLGASLLGGLLLHRALPQAVLRLDRLRDHLSAGLEGG